MADKIKIVLDVDGEKKVINSLEEAQKLVNELNDETVDIKLEIDGEEAANSLEDVKNSLDDLQDSGGEAPGLFKKISQSWKGLNNVLKASIIGFIAGAVIELVQNNRQLEPVVNAISDAFGVLGKALSPILTALTKVLVPVIKAITPLLSALTPIFEAIGVALEFVAKGIEFVAKPLSALGDTLSSVFGGSSAKEVEEFNKKQRELETQVARNEAAAEKFRGEREKLLAIAESEAVAEEDRLELFQKAAAIGRKESAQRIEAAQRRVDLLKEDIRLNGESQEILQELAEAEQELSTQKADAATLEADNQARILDNASAIAEAENLTFQEKEKQINASFEQIRLQKEQNIEAIQRKLTEIDITEELIKQNTSGKQQAFFINEVRKAREETNSELETANLELESLNKKEETLLQNSLETNAAISNRNRLQQLGQSKELIEAELGLAQAQAKTAQDQLNNLVNFQERRRELIDNQFEQDVINAEGNADLIRAAELRKQTEILKLEEDFFNKRKDLNLQLNDSIKATIREQSIELPSPFTEANVDQLVADANMAGSETGESFIEGLISTFEDPEFQERFSAVTQLLSESLSSINELASQLFQNRIDSLTEGLASLDEQLSQQTERVSEAAERAKNATGEQKKAAIAALRAEEKEQAKLTKQKIKAEEEIAKVKRRQAIADKANAIAQAGIQTALGIVGAFAPPEGGPIRGSVLAGIIGALGAIQIATIAATPIPEFAEGGYTGQGDKFEPAGVVHKGEYVIPKHMVESPKFSSTIQSLEKSRLRGYADGGMVGNIERQIDTATSTEVVVDVREIIDQSSRVKAVKSRATL